MAYRRKRYSKRRKSTRKSAPRQRQQTVKLVIEHRQGGVMPTEAAFMQAATPRKRVQL